MRIFATVALYCARLRWDLVLIVVGFAIGCQRHANDAPAPATPVQATPALAAKANSPSERSANSPTTPKRVAPELPGLHNLIEAAPGVYSGSEPHGEDGFASLEKLGVKVIVSVDGARPDLELAHQHGLKYVHVPIGYDGIPANAGAALAKLARTTQESIYVHCHHGKHRGPSATAALCVAMQKMTSDESRSILELAGTGKEYAGLWRDVAKYAPPSSDVELPNLVEVAEVGSFTAAMAVIDRHWDNLKLSRDANWATPADHPDLAPAQEALLLREGFQEAARNLSADHDEQFRKGLAEAESLAAQLEAVLKNASQDAISKEQATELAKQLDGTCKRCHAQYRN